jgi:hypothetical protein
VTHPNHPTPAILALGLALGCRNQADDSSRDDSQSVPSDDSVPIDDSVPTDDSSDPDAPFALENVSASIGPTIGSIVVVTWEQNHAARVHLEYSFDEDEKAAPVWLSSPDQALEGGAHRQLLLGIPYGETVTWRLVYDPDGDEPPGSTADATIANDPLPAGAPEPTILVSNPALQDPSLVYLLGSINEENSNAYQGQYWVFILDRKGRTVWAWPSPSNRISFHVQPSFDGDELLVDYNSFWRDFVGQTGSIARMKIDGSVVEEIATPYLHHPFTELADHTIVWGAYVGGQGIENLEEVDAAGNRRTIFSCNDFHDMLDVNEPCGSNTVWWDPETDRFFFSFFFTNTVVEIDHATGAALAWYGELGTTWTFDPPASQFWYQHGGHLTDSGTFIVSSRRAPAAEETVVREYTLDAGTHTLTEVANFGIGEGIYAHDLGEAYRLPNGNFLHNYGTTGRLREATADGTVVWDLTWDGNDDWLGRTTALSDLYAFAP